MAETLHDLICEECTKVFQRTSRQLSSSKCKGVKRFFCNRSCSVTYQNKHFGHGEHRSWIEKWLEVRIGELYPTMTVMYGNKEIIGSELDIYIPEHKVAIELSGPTHYLPIYGQEVLERTQANDAHKRNACIQAGIDLREVDMSKMASVKRDPEFLRICDAVYAIFDALCQAPESKP